MITTINATVQAIIDRSSFVLAFAHFAHSDCVDVDITTLAGLIQETLDPAKWTLLLAMIAVRGSAGSAILRVLRGSNVTTEEFLARRAAKRAESRPSASLIPILEESLAACVTA